MAAISKKFLPIRIIEIHTITLYLALISSTFLPQIYAKTLMLKNEKSSANSKASNLKNNLNSNSCSINEMSVLQNEFLSLLDNDHQQFLRKNSNARLRQKEDLQYHRKTLLIENIYTCDNTSAKSANTRDSRAAKYNQKIINNRVLSKRTKSSKNNLQNNNSNDIFDRCRDLKKYYHHLSKLIQRQGRFNSQSKYQAPRLNSEVTRAIFSILRRSQGQCRRSN